MPPLCLSWTCRSLFVCHVELCFWLLYSASLSFLSGPVLISPPKKISILTTWQRPQHLPLRMVCLSSGNFLVGAAGSQDAPTSLQGSTCTSCTGCSEQRETETPSSGRSWCGEGWMQIWRKEKRGRRRKGWREGMRQGWPRPWWGSESEPGIKQASERRDPENTSGSKHQDISGLRSHLPATLLRMRRPT